ncbi:hypothetical protein A3768_0657 [Ralstonia solanacearum]|nr:hypothetical protein F504_2839 [Ralstonia pseudosolanacearum FQY_4]ANH31832.1 hypothetical protein A3768_0657 [Ralstonia solanacearum]
MGGNSVWNGQNGIACLAARGTKSTSGLTAVSSVPPRFYPSALWQIKTRNILITFTALRFADHRGNLRMNLRFPAGSPSAGWGNAAAAPGSEPLPPPSVAHFRLSFRQEFA